MGRKKWCCNAETISARTAKKRVGPTRESVRTGGMVNGEAFMKSATHHGCNYHSFAHGWTISVTVLILYKEIVLFASLGLGFEYAAS
jgi:hypothetical protein